MTVDTVSISIDRAEAVTGSIMFISINGVGAAAFEKATVLTDGATNAFDAPRKRATSDRLLIVFILDW